MENYEEEKAKAPVTIILKPNGPASVTGDFIVIDEQGNELPKKEKFSICRCGFSKTMPICDGAHKGIPV